MARPIDVCRSRYVSLVDPVSLVINICLVVLTAVGAFAALWQARAARSAQAEAQVAQRAAEVARDESLELAKKATEAAERHARAQEIANEIELAKLPKPHVDWLPRASSRDSRILVNVGNVNAINVVATGNSGVHTDEESRSQLVAPGDSIKFWVLPATFGSERPRLHVEWDDERTGEHRTWERFVQ